MTIIWTWVDWGLAMDRVSLHFFGKSSICTAIDNNRILFFLFKSTIRTNILRLDQIEIFPHNLETVSLLYL